ncbi:DUF2461 domain-containing protein [Lutimonas halocynthiae]|uniref:DUF2461 domain-containing protein n=1 Tax=Lutimonas halocynthiae TaxID=1446477 RepID=UPI0025B57B35|nr:DUF2461 domain-containing protein [Lutimonas halocynthiae]MDN3642445.1 DUF2461 domain-containing protein [Lutimonas halocynthiae]
MQYFSQDYLEFFKELAANNHKDWFDLNRKRYETEVREPFKVFIGDLIKALSRDDTSLAIEPKDAIFRINRDIRFSKDKTPYKLNNSAIISSEGRKDKNHPGIYIELGPEKLAFYGGIYMPNTKQVQKLRSYFKQHSSKLNNLLEDANFKNVFGDLHGEKSKRIPGEFKESAEGQPLLMNKQWYYFTHLPPEIITANNLMETILELEQKARSMKIFLTKALYNTI